MNKYFFEELNKTGVAVAFFTPKGNGGWDYDDADSLAHYEALAADFNITTEQIVRTKQTHTSVVKCVNATNGGEGVCKPFGTMGFDGMITNTPGLMLCTKEADCVPVYILDPVKKAIAMVHSGWRGTVGQISVDAINKMITEYGCEPQDLLVGIGPRICAKCYEVSGDLLKPFADKYTTEEMEKLFIPEEGKEGKYLLDLKQAIEFSVLKAGVKMENIFDCGYCTYHDDKFDSYRLEGGTDNRMLTGIILK